MSSGGAALRAAAFRIFYGPADDPLHAFYIPALSASVRYDRTAGFFSSTALAVAAAGVARLIANGGRMRLLVGADLSADDVEAIRRGHDLEAQVTQRLLERFPEPQDALLRQRLEVVAWMVAEGALQIRVVLPRDEHGLPIPAHLARDYYHPKTGLFTDAQGDQVAFSGSVNESVTGWVKNYETFTVYFSWDATVAYLAQVASNFQGLWEGRERDWIALDIPDAVTQRLLSYRPRRAPTRDPLEEEPQAPEVPGDIPQAERLLLQFVRDAPFLPDASGLGAVTSAVTPWPHQSRVADAVIASFPERAMFCDEVGLGKTIEAGLVLRQLLLSRRVRRCLILTPKSVLKQWQEELWEKFALPVPRYDSGQFWDVKDTLLPNDATNPWDAFPVMLASSQLAKRSERREQILAAEGWDLLVVDEAHHARRRDFRERIYRPNRLLELLNAVNARNKAASLLLMTATPMQVHPVEVWDLLKLLGMGGRWGADEDNFLGFFGEMRKPFWEADWEFVFNLVKDHLDTGGVRDIAMEAEAKAAIGPVRWSVLRSLPEAQGQRTQRLKQLGASARPYVKEMARRHTPLRRYIHRNTRSLLREYQKRGILQDNVPRRKPEIVRVAMRPDEVALYERIDEYISQFYQKYENERRGLGFVMTVYRRRLTSSFYAVRCSLERRLAYLRGEVSPEAVYEDDDLEQDELSRDVSEDILGDADRSRFAAELAYVQDFIQELRVLSIADSKLEHLKIALNEVFKQRDKVLVFTQYTDTMDYLRNQLVEVYGREVACYSGRGGEVWNGIAWVLTTKEEVKQEFGAGRIRIMLCTESASEGLNLQTCGVLINYDMPWNPMRVEQRIGRIDRIGQRYEQVWISNYFYRDTIEDLIYQRLADRIDWFEVVVGDLQPILAEVSEATRRLAMLPAEQREAELVREIAVLRERIQNRELEALNLDEFAIVEEYVPTQLSPVTLQDLEDLLLTSSVTAHLFRAHPEIPEAHSLTLDGTTFGVTFSPACFDEYPDSLQLLTFGNPLLDEVLALVPLPETAQEGLPLRFQGSAGHVDLRDWYVSSEDGGPRRLTTLGELRDWLKERPVVSEGLCFSADAERLFEKALGDVKARQQDVIRHRSRGALLAERARAQRVLVRAALVELALGQQGSFLDGESYPLLFNEQAILGLQRHRFPWSALVSLAYDPRLAVDANAPYYQQIQSSTKESLHGRFAQLVDEARKAVHALTAAQEGAGQEGEEARQVERKRYRV